MLIRYWYGHQHSSEFICVDSRYFENIGCAIDIIVLQRRGEWHVSSAYFVFMGPASHPLVQIKGQASMSYPTYDRFVRVYPIKRMMISRHGNVSRITGPLWGQPPLTKVHEANMGPIWGRQDPGGSHVGPMNFDIWVGLSLAKGKRCGALTFLRLVHVTWTSCWANSWFTGHLKHLNTNITVMVCGVCFIFSCCGYIIYPYCSGLLHCNHPCPCACEVTLRMQAMTSSNGNILLVAGPFVRETTSHRWISFTKAMRWHEALIFSLMCAWTNGLANSQEVGDLRRHDSLWRYCDMIPEPNITQQSVNCVWNYWSLRYKL